MFKSNHRLQKDFARMQSLFCFTFPVRWCIISSTTRTKEVIPLIKAVAFDFDHTLYDRDRTLELMAPEFMTHFADKLRDDITLKQVVAATLNADRAGFAPPDRPARRSDSIKMPWGSTYRSLVATGIFKDVPTHEEYYYGFILPAFPKYIDMYPDAVSTLLKLREMGYTTGLLTNGTSEFQNAKLDFVGLRDHIDRVILCGDLEYQKPHVSTFEAICEAMGCAPHEALYVGDNPVNDVEGARRAGMIPVWMRSVGLWFEGLEPSPYAIDAIGELPELVERINGTIG